ncbi:winged helix-turn-helix transcriptional regulator [Halobaculum sp. MBLA0147]|uniref:winged helix-turn-helix transcriptional regulator n=1 Tax=Halobaculum sp. MBLA0147 TaxID=3079934 RepID=UPI003526A26A
MSTDHTPVGRMDSSYEGTQETLVEVAEVLGRKWHTVILHQLLTAGALGFSDLGSRVNGISNKMLSDSLGALEERGLVRREIVEEKPVRVEYSLTERGRAMEDLLGAMVSWGREHGERADDRPATPDGPERPLADGGTEVDR